MPLEDTQLWWQHSATPAGVRSARRCGLYLVRILHAIAYCIVVLWMCKLIVPSVCSSARLETADCTCFYLFLLLRPATQVVGFGELPIRWGSLNMHTVQQYMALLCPKMPESRDTQDRSSACSSACSCSTDCSCERNPPCMYSPSLHPLFFLHTNYFGFRLQHCG